VSRVCGGSRRLRAWGRWRTSAPIMNWNKWCRHSLRPPLPKNAQGWAPSVDEGSTHAETASPAEALKAELDKKDAEIKRLAREWILRG